MQSLIARKALHKSVRGFASSATRAQAVPLEKPVLVKEFKIYRWVRFTLWFSLFLLAATTTTTTTIPISSSRCSHSLFGLWYLCY